MSLVIEETGQNKFNPDESKADIVIGIDFGTTFSGVAFTLTASIPENIKDKSTLVNHLNIIKGWPGNRMAEKVPSLLSYKNNNSTPSWGFRAQKPGDEVQIAHFKLGLQRDLRVYSPVPNDSPLGGYMTDYNWRHPRLGSKKALNFTTDYLSCIYNYSKERLDSHYGHVRLQNQQTTYVITVPAIWGDEAKELTRRAAAEAGIPRRELMLITEPEAAAVYCSCKCKQEKGLKVDDRFLICDAGGGTVVLTLEPFKIQECSAATGAACASIYLDLNFQKLIRTKLGRFADSILVKSVPTDVNKFFDTLKRDFDPYDTECENEYQIPLKDAPERPEVGVSEGSLTLKKKELIEHVFEPIFKQILSLIKTQIRVIGVNNVKVFLVGGLGSNIYLQKYLIDKLKSKTVEVVQPPEGFTRFWNSLIWYSVTAIMCGAVLYKLGLDLVQSRIMTMSYGVTYNTPFKPGHHPISRKTECLDGITRCENVMEWNISPAQHRESKVMHSIKLYICDSISPPEYLDEVSIKSLCSLNLDLKTLPSNAMTRHSRNSGEYWRVDYELGLRFGPAGIEFRLVYEGEVRGLVTHEYPS